MTIIILHPGGHENGEVVRRIARLETKIDNLHEALMTFSQEALSLIAQLRDATTLVGQRIQVLLDRLLNDPSDEEETQIKAELETEISRLTAMGASNTEPIPEVPPLGEETQFATKGPELTPAQRQARQDDTRRRRAAMNPQQREADEARERNAGQNQAQTLTPAQRQARDEETRRRRANMTPFQRQADEEKERKAEEQRQAGQRPREE